LATHADVSLRFAVKVVTSNTVLLVAALVDATKAWCMLLALGVSRREHWLGCAVAIVSPLANSSTPWCHHDTAVTSGPVVAIVAPCGGQLWYRDALSTEAPLSIVAFIAACTFHLVAQVLTNAFPINAHVVVGSIVPIATASAVGLHFVPDTVAKHAHNPPVALLHLTNLALPVCELASIDPSACTVGIANVVLGFGIAIVARTAFVQLAVVSALSVEARRIAKAGLGWTLNPGPVVSDAPIDASTLP
jgi:hypothetical protein